MSNYQARLSTVNGNDDDDTQGTVEDLFGSLDIAERNRDAERIQRNVDASKASKIRDGTATIDGYIEHAEDRDAEFRADLSAATRRSLQDIPEPSPSAAARVPSGFAKAKKTSPGLFSNLRSNISAALTSPYLSGKSPLGHPDDKVAEVTMGETPRSELTHHANDFHDSLIRPIDEGMTFSSPPSQVGHNVTASTVNLVRFQSEDDEKLPIRQFQFGKQAVTYPNFDAGITTKSSLRSKSPATFAHSTATSPATFAKSSDTSPVTFAKSTVPLSATYAHSTVPSPAANAQIPYGYVHPAYNVQHPNYNGYPAYHDTPRYAQHVPGADVMNANHSTLFQELRTNNPPQYQATSPRLLQEKHPHDVPSSGPGLISNKDYEDALIRGVAERSPIVAYQASYVEQPSQAAMSNSAGPFTQNLIPNPHYSATAAAQAYARMHPNENGRI